MGTLQTDVRFLSGKVEKGKQLGKTIGFPTANLKVSLKSLPPKGVYGVYVYKNYKQYVGVMNIGTRPTFQDGEHTTIEVHLLDFNETIYGETLLIELLFPIRSEKKFSNLDALIAQLKKDVAFTRRAVSEIQKKSVAN